MTNEREESHPGRLGSGGVAFSSCGAHVRTKNNSVGLKPLGHSAHADAHAVARGIHNPLVTSDLASPADLTRPWSKP